ncbi:unnamed protein product, partial [Ectocarpus sp. 4 AP-2014]
RVNVDSRTSQNGRQILTQAAGRSRGISETALTTTGRHSRWSRQETAWREGSTRGPAAHYCCPAH